MRGPAATGEQFPLYAAPGPPPPADPIEAVAEHAGRPWLALALDAVCQVARRQDEFTADDVWPLVDEPVYDRRALGAVMRRAARYGVIRSTGQYRPSVNAQNHGRPVQVWRSLVRSEEA